MPAPTALKQAESAPLANDISLPVEGKYRKSEWTVNYVECV